MRRQLLLSLLAVALGALNATTATAQELEINATNFPDEAFRKYVTENIDNNQDGKLSAEEIESVTEIYVSGSGSLKGIENFTNLTNLDCSFNNLTELDLSQCTQLSALNCQDNNLTKLDISNCTKLTSLVCENNNLTELNLSNCNVLQRLYCSYNNLTKLDLSNCNVLEILYCDYNNLTELDLSNCNVLQHLYCSYNNLIALKLSSFISPNASNNRREFDDVIINYKSYVKLKELEACGFDRSRLSDASIIETINGTDYFCIGDCESESMPCERTYEYRVTNEPYYVEIYFTISRFVNTIKLNASGYATYSNAEPVTISDGVTAYVAEVDEDKSLMVLKPIEGNVIPAKTGVLLKGEPNAKVTLTRGGEAAAFDRNDLRASLVEDTYYGNVYVLSGNKFVKYVGEKLTPNKAYLVMSDEFGTNTSGLKIAFFDNPTAITDVNTARGDGNAPTYNLNGQRVSPDTKGLVIRNGRKIVNR